MSEVATNVTNSESVMQTVLDTLNSGWGYTIGGIIIVVAAGYWIYKKLNTPRFMVQQIRRRNLKEMKKQGADAEGSEAMADLDRLLDSVEAYATNQGMTGAAMSQLLAPLQKVNDNKSGASFYHSMAHIAKTIGDVNLAKNLSKKSKQVKSSSALMAGLLKRAGV
ncbi:hypothetical protein ACXJY6_00635 [Vibrio sp. RC27]